MDRRSVLVAIAAMPALGPLSALAAAKLGLCQPCNGHGQCDSGYCGAGGRCLSPTNICAGRKRHPNFRCKGSRPKCCGKDGCKPA